MISKTLKDALGLLNDGQSWTKGALVGWTMEEKDGQYTYTTQATYCIMGAVNAVCGDPIGAHKELLDTVTRNQAVNALAQAVAVTHPNTYYATDAWVFIPDFNDDEDTRWEDVEHVFKYAIKQAEADGR